MAARTVELATGVPGLATERAVTWPKRTHVKLQNGLEVVMAEAHAIPKFHGELFFKSGNAAALHRAPGLAEMTATVVRTGTVKRLSRQLEEDLRRIGADLSSSAGADNSAIAFAGLSEFAEPLLGLVNELAREASFPEGEFERERRQKLEEVKLERTQPGFLASERLRKVLFGTHPYGQVSASEAQVAAYKREDLRTVYREFYTPQNALLLLVGDFDPSSMLKSVDAVFGNWSGHRPAARPRGASARAPRLLGACARRRASTNRDGLPRHHAEAPRLGEARTYEQLVRRRVQLAAGDEYPRRQRLHVQSAKWRECAAAARLFFCLRCRTQRRCRCIADGNLLRNGQAAFGSRARC